MIEFQVKGSVAQTIKDSDDVEHTAYITRWFDCTYDTKTKKAFYLRAGGAQGAELELSAELVTALTD